MPLLFEPITLDKQKQYLKYFAECPQKTSDYSFVNLWGWADEYGLFWAWEENLVWIKQNKPEVAFWAPVGPWEEADWNTCLEGRGNGQIVFTRIPDRLVESWKVVLKNRLRIDEARDHWDYLYAVSDLVLLKGNRFHKKKNLLNQFEKQYDYSFVALGPETVDQALAMQTDWCTWRDCESSDALSAENRSIERILKAWKNLNYLIGGAIMVGSKMAAYTVAESLTREMILIHFEKADTAYKGGYQAINQMFLEHLPDKFTVVNREQDLDDEGLRRAKLSYHPVDFLRKYRVVIS